MTEIDFLKDQVHKSFSGDPWHGSSLADLLKDVDETAAAARPISGVHTIWEIVLHLAGWTEEVTRRLGGGPPDFPFDGDWPSQGKATAGRWKAARMKLDDAQADLERKIAKMKPARLDEIVGQSVDRPLGTGTSCRAMILGLIQHNAYHGGQIGLLRKGLEKKAPPAGKAMHA
jgi:uncharacterized damage-inducible protein DinB